MPMNNNSSTAIAHQPAPGELIRAVWVYDGVDTNIETIKDLLSRGADVNEKGDDGDTILIRAIDSDYENTELVRLLIDNGAVVNEKGSNNDTALHIAAIMGYESIVRTLIDSGALLDAKNDDGLTAQDRAMDCEHLFVVQLLQDAAEAPIRAAETAIEAAAEKYSAIHEATAHKQQLLRAHAPKFKIKPA